MRIPPPLSQARLTPLSQEMQSQFFDQEYSYLASGTQSCAFVSADGKYVLKFLQKKKLLPFLRECFSSERAIKKEQKLQSALQAYELAFEELKEETGLLYLHFAPIPLKRETIRVKSRWGWSYTLPLTNTLFVIQEKAELIAPYLEKLYVQKTPEAAAKATESLLQLVQHRIEKGFTDRDQAVRNNYGFVGTRPIHLDVGGLYKGEKGGEFERIKRRVETLCKKAQLFPYDDPLSQETQ